MVNYLSLLIPGAYYRRKLYEKVGNFSNNDAVQKRVDYYNKIDTVIDLNSKAIKLSDLKLEKGSKTYYFDLYEYSKYFDQELKGHFLFGDITKVPVEPSLVKSRPIGSNNAHSVLLKWNKLRHFTYVKNDKKEFLNKKNMLVGRGKVHPPQSHRIKFLEKYFGHPLCDIGKVNNNELDSKWLVNRMTIDEQLEYKFILCLEGNDVASNLKWVMSSNSVAVMPKAKFETWFMEGLLIPDFHYILIKDDYSDLESKLRYYIENPKKALDIIKNANAHVAQFKDAMTEDIISLVVLKKYFEKTKQIVKS